jgi:beta-carotene ketolase (CrtO type)
MVTENYIPNIKDAILKKISTSTIDYENKPSISIRGTLACGSLLSYQTKSMRPIPQLCNYKIPSIGNVYLCGEKTAQALVFQWHLEEMPRK